MVATGDEFAAEFLFVLVSLTIICETVEHEIIGITATKANAIASLLIAW